MDRSGLSLSFSVPDATLVGPVYVRSTGGNSTVPVPFFVRPSVPVPSLSGMPSTESVASPTPSVAPAAHALICSVPSVPSRPPEAFNAPASNAPPIANSEKLLRDSEVAFTSLVMDTLECLSDMASVPLT